MITVLGAYTYHVGGTLPTTIEYCSDNTTSLVKGEGPSTAVNLLTRQLQSARRHPNESVAEDVRVENLNEAVLTTTRQEAQ